MRLRIKSIHHHLLRLSLCLMMTKTHTLLNFPCSFIVFLHIHVILSESSGMQQLWAPAGRMKSGSASRGHASTKGGALCTLIEWPQSNCGYGLRENVLLLEIQFNKGQGVELCEMKMLRLCRPPVMGD